MKLSVIMPAYNEQEGIAAAVDEVRRCVFPLVPECELIVIDDGSRDGTGAVLDQLAANEPRLRVIHQPNGGHGPALRAGLDAARGEFVFLIDSDQQIPLDHFDRLWEAGRTSDLAMGCRRRRGDAWPRRVLTRLIRWLLPVLLGVRLYDANVPFKVLRRGLWEQARPLLPADTLTPSLFLAVFAAATGARVAQVDVPHVDRRTGTVSIRKWKLLRFCVRAGGQLWAFRARLGRLRRAHP